MAVFRRSGSLNWFIEFTYLGETRRQSSGTRNKAQAEALERLWRQQIHDRVMLGKKPSIPLGDAIKRYYQTALKPTGKPTKLKKDIYCLKQIADHFGAARTLRDIAVSEVAEWRDGLVTEHDAAPATANRLYTYVRAIYNMARTEWHVDAPRLEIKGLKEPPGRVRWLSDAEESSLLLACAPHVREVITFLMDTGARKAEAAALTWEKIEWGEGVASIRFDATDTKTSKARRVRVPSRTFELLRRSKEANAPAQDGDRVFRFLDFKTGEPRDIGNFRNGFEAACRRAAIDDFHIHDCRHHYASRLARGGVRIEVIGELLGHKTLKMTMRYAHLCQNANLDTAVATLG